MPILLGRLHGHVGLVHQGVLRVGVLQGTGNCQHAVAAAQVRHAGTAEVFRQVWQEGARADIQAFAAKHVGMVEQLLERYIGPMHASLAVKKARLLIATVEDRPLAVSPYPTRYTLDTPAIELLNHANVFCREGLDIGTRAFLPHLPKNLGSARVADLGCGNGVLAIASALQNPDAQYTLVDESYMAVQSAQENWQAALGQRDVIVRAADGLAGQEPDSLDVVLCNPPFHQQQVVGDFLAWRMFQQARETLVVGGALYIVGNRHLGYHTKLARLFRGVEQVATTPKFVILKARK